MSLLRLLLRAPLFALWMVLAWVLWILGVLPAWALGRAVAWRTFAFQTWARVVLRLLGIRVRRDGEIPEGAFLLVSNHLSYLDIVVLASTLRCAFVSKAEVRGWPVLGGLARMMGTIFVDRARKRDVLRVADEIQRTLAQGTGVVVFPEGTSTRGAEVAPFRSSLLEPAARAGLPVRYAALSYRTAPGDPPAHLAVAWWGDMTFGGHFLDLLRLAPFEAEISFGREPIEERDRKLLATKLHQAVCERFVPTLEPRDACLSLGT